MTNVRFEWDEAKNRSNRRKHGVAFEEAASVFLDPLARTYPDPDHSTTEPQEITIGYSRSGRVLFVAHVERRGRLRIISARRASARERKQYEQSKAKR